MRIAAVVACALIVSALPCAAHAAQDQHLDAPPAGLVPTAEALSAILAAHDRARSLQHREHDTIIEDWAFVDSGLAGHEHLERSGTDYHSRIVTDAYAEEFGQVSGKRWHRDANGFTSPSTDLDDRSFVAVRVLEDAADPKNDVKVIGKTTDSAPAYVLQVKRPGHLHPEWIYYDVTTGNIVRVIYAEGKDRIVSTYDDFRTVDGLSEAWHVHDAWWDRALDDDWHVTEFHAGMPVDASQFTAPKNDTSRNTSSVRQALPARFIDGYVVIRVQVGDRGLDFELDSSQAESLIDSGVAGELHLPGYGQATRLTTGGPIAYATVIPDADVGPVHLHNFAVRTSDVAYKPSSTTKIVGILGYDFLASNVVHVDYVNRLVEVIPNADFSGAKPVQNGIEIPFQIDDGVPLVPVQFGNAYTDRVVLNCDMPVTLAFGPFVEAHAEVFQDLFTGTHPRFVPFADGGTFGATALLSVSRVTELRFAIADYQSLAIFTTLFPYSTTGQSVDAMLGLDYLHFFDLYFDYPHDRFFVVPNKWFYQIFKKSPQVAGSFVDLLRLSGSWDWGAARSSRGSTPACRRAVGTELPQLRRTDCKWL